MPDTHAVLSPSAAHRWMACPASIRMTNIVSTPVQSSSPWAAEGTTAHTVAELCARRWVLKSIGVKEFNAEYKSATKGYTLEQREDMLAHGKAYAQYLAKRLRVHPYSRLMLEQQLDTGIDQCWGTSDAVIASPEHIEIVDYKYGTGIRVDAKGNEQLMFYALGALLQYGDILGDTEVVTVGVYQPRLNHYDTWEITADDLRAWAEEAKVVAAEALSDNAHFGPSESACRWCPAAGECRPRMEAALSADFTQDPDLLTPEEIGNLLEQKAEALNFWQALEAHALKIAYSDGLPIPGWKVVLSGGRRQITDVESALAVLYGLGYEKDDVVNPTEPKLKGIGQLERLLGKTKFNDFLGELAKPPPGRPSLAREDDPRPPVSALAEAQKEFSDDHSQ